MKIAPHMQDILRRAMEPHLPDMVAYDPEGARLVFFHAILPISEISELGYTYREVADMLVDNGGRPVWLTSRKRRFLRKDRRTLKVEVQFNNWCLQ